MCAVACDPSTQRQPLRKNSQPQAEGKRAQLVGLGLAELGLLLPSQRPMPWGDSGVSGTRKRPPVAMRLPQGLGPGGTPTNLRGREPSTRGGRRLSAQSAGRLQQDGTPVPRPGPGRGWHGGTGSPSIPASPASLILTLVPSQGSRSPGSLSAGGRAGSLRCSQSPSYPPGLGPQGRPSRSLAETREGREGFPEEGVGAGPAGKAGAPGSGSVRRGPWTHDRFEGAA